MRFSVRHHTWYRYDVPVRLAPHVLRMTPRPDQGVLRYHDLRVYPEPIQLRYEDDEHGNRTALAEFQGVCTELRVESAFELQTALLPDFVGSWPLLPWSGPRAVDPEVAAFARTVAIEARSALIPFLDHLCRTICERMTHEVRTDGAAESARQTLLRGGGACRDLTVLFMEAARSQGILTRFVSGYQARGREGPGPRFLHAWPEAFVPGFGFRGWDPTHGTRVSDGHVALCAAPAQAQTMPVEGGYYFDGPVVNSTLDFSLEIAAEPG